jgi:Ca2+-binding RTX toxin-like protein
MRRGLLPPICAIGIALLPALPASAGPPTQTTCTFDEPAARVDATLVGTSNLLLRNGDEIWVEGACGGATVFNTDLIVVTDANPVGMDTVFTIVPFDGFAPGLTDEGADSEIEIEIGFAAGHDSALRIHTDVGHQHISVDGHSINLNADEAAPDADIAVSGVGSCDDGDCYDLEVQTGSGADVIDHRADPADEGTVVSLIAQNGEDLVRSHSSKGTRTFVLGGGGNDVIRTNGDEGANGGTGADLIIGGDRHAVGDAIEGGTGRDRIFGRAGPDILRGGAGPDTIVGDLGADTVSGEHGDDRLWGGSDPDDVQGDAGVDRCELEAGQSLGEHRCEIALHRPPPDR